MAFTYSKLAASAAGLAALSMAVAPAVAAELPVAGTMAAADAYDSSAETVEQYRYRHRDRGIDAGDVIAGVAVLGAIAAIASSSRNRGTTSRDNVRYRDNDYRYGERRSDRYSYGRTSGQETRGIDRAVEMCVDAIERDQRDEVADVNRAERNAGGWYVGGQMQRGQGFSCRIDNDGRIRSADVDGGYSARNQGNDDYRYDDYRNDDYRYEGAANGQRDDYRYGAATTGRADPQLSDADYARARAATRGDGSYRYDSDDAPYDDRYGQQQPGASDVRPAYPGGPLPGEEGYEQSGAEWQGDDRYDIAANR